ncbi:MAG: M61 family metallopeptidase [Thermoplasmata archaeon]
MTIHYELRYLGPSSTRVEVQVVLPPEPKGSAELVFPSWVPGSYVIRDPARYVIRASRPGPDGRPVAPVERVGKSRWQVRYDSDPSPIVRFELFGFELSKLGLDTDADHLFINPGFALPYVDGHQSEPCELQLRIPAHWRVVTELEEIDREARRYRARSYDELVDSPVDCGTIRESIFRPAGIPHRLSLCGEPADMDARRTVRDLEQIVSATIAYFGSSPLNHYTFFFHLADAGDGGLEHATSNSCVIPRDIFRPAKKYRRFLHLAAHEYFHLYNVKRIRPAVFGSFDYTQEMYTRLLWWMEGATDYGSHLLLRRSGLLSPTQYLEDLAEMIRAYREIPGRLVTSLEEASLSAWVGFYKPSDESVNQSVSYYLKGGLVSWAMDMEIRTATRNSASLDTVLRYLWKECGERGRGIGERELPRLVEQATGLNLGEFFERYVAGVQEPDFDRLARSAALTLTTAPREPSDDDPAGPGYLGIDLGTTEGVTRVKMVRDGTPARAGGLRPGDELIGIDGRRIHATQWNEALERLPPGQEIELLLFRRGRELRRRVTLATAPPKKLLFRPSTAASDLERTIHTTWLNGSILPAPAPASASNSS